MSDRNETEGAATGPAGFLPVFRLAAGAMTLLFAFAAAVQWNDPDPLRWVAIYGLAAALAAMAAVGRTPLVPNAVAAALFLGLALLGVPRLGEAGPEAFRSLEMQQTQDEVPRETAGLFLCAFWSGITAIVARRRGPVEIPVPDAPRG